MSAPHYVDREAAMRGEATVQVGHMLAWSDPDGTVHEGVVTELSPGIAYVAGAQGQSIAVPIAPLPPAPHCEVCGEWLPGGPHDCTKETPNE